MTKFYVVPFDVSPDLILEGDRELITECDNLDEALDAAAQDADAGYESKIFKATVVEIRK